MIYIIIILSVLLAVSVFLLIKERQKSTKIKSEWQKKLDEAENDIKVLSSSVENCKSQISKSERRVSELKGIVDSQKFRMIEMLKNLTVVQKTVFSGRGYIKSLFPDYFVLDVPFENAGGDFYKFASKGDYVLAACGNSGVSGVNGLIMGILNVVFLSEIIERVDLSTIPAGRILDMLRGKYAHLAESNNSYRHEDDFPVNFTVCIINQKEHTLSYAGAYGSMCLLRKSYPGTNRREVDVHEFRGDRMNFAVSFGRRKNYTSETIELEKDDKLYIKTDGFVNQRGGSSGNRFGDIYFRQMLMKHSSESMSEQMQSFKNEFDKWRGNDTRANDILIIGLALKVKAVMKPIPAEPMDLDPEIDE